MWDMEINLGVMAMMRTRKAVGLNVRRVVSAQLCSWKISLVMASCSTTSSAMFWITAEITDAREREREREREVIVLIEIQGHSGIFISNTCKLKTHKLFFLRGCNCKGHGNVSSFLILNIINKFASYCYIRWERAGVGSKSRYLERDDMIILHTYIYIYIYMLGFKDLGFYVFRILNCIVGKPWSKQCI